MPLVKFVLNEAAVGELLRGPKMQALLARKAQQIADAANSAAGLSDGHVIESEVGPHRARVAVLTDTAEAMVSEAEDLSLSKSIDAGRA